MDHPIHGEIYMLKELFEPYTLMPTNEVVVGKCIRTSGILKQILITNELCIIEHEGSSLLIDLKLVDMGSLIEDHLYQFLGELKGRFEKELPSNLMQKYHYYLEAKVVRNIDGMDLNLYSQALNARRKFLENL